MSELVVRSGLLPVPQCERPVHQPLKRTTIWPAARLGGSLLRRTSAIRRA